MSMLSQFLNPGGAYEAAGDEMRQYYDQAQGMMQPYIQHGQDAYGGLSGAMGRLLDPAALQSEWAQGYEESPAARQAQEMAKQSGLSAASGLGLMGSSTALEGIQAGSANIAMQDRQNYLNDLMQKYMAGTGIGQNIYGTGAQMAGQGAQQAMNMGQTMGGLAAGQQQAGAGLIGQGIGALGSLAGSFFGPMGTAAGGAIGKKIGDWATGG